MATGTLLNGNVMTTPANGNTVFVSRATATMTFNVAAGEESFFSPNLLFFVNIPTA